MALSVLCTLKVLNHTPRPHCAPCSPGGIAALLKQCLGPLFHGDHTGPMNLNGKHLLQHLKCCMNESFKTSVPLGTHLQ